MNTGMKIGAALLGVVAMFAAVELSTCSVLPTASAQGSDTKLAYSAEDPIVSTVYGEAVEISGPVVEGCQSCQAAPAPVVESCGCQSCQTVAAPATCGCKSCGSHGGCSLGQYKANCDCQYCTLESKKVDVEKSRFKVEQKEVCIPAVRLPWMKCNPPKRSRVRTVNILKKEKYKDGKTCEYKWSVHEPEDYENAPEPTPASSDSAPAGSGSKSTSDGSDSSASGGSGTMVFESYPDPSAETVGTLELSDPTEALGDIPRPPLEK